MSNKNKQHFVPKFYLKKFAVNNFFSMFNCTIGFKEKVPYGDQCYKHKLYGVDNIYENKLSQLESIWGASFNNILSNPKSISEDDEHNIKSFILFQRLRTISAFNQMRNMVYDVTSQVMPILCQMNGVEVDNKSIKEFAYHYSQKFESTEDTMKTLLKTAEKLNCKMDNLGLVIVENQSKDLEFITSDNPVIIGNTFQPTHGVGFDAIGFYALLPISSKYYLILFDEKMYPYLKSKKIVFADKHIVSQLNLLQFKNCVNNIYFQNSKSLQMLLIDISVIKQKLYIKYNDNFNNFYTIDIKNKYNQQFIGDLMLMPINILIKHVRIVIPNWFDVVDIAKPFVNKLNFNFSRSSTTEEVLSRISFLNSTGEVLDELDIKRDLDDEKLKLDYEKFLKWYFGI